ncbi:MAG: phytochelatin synthase [Archangium sp.]|nr:phytochelatin synthase [Archangium sp.]
MLRTSTADFVPSRPAVSRDPEVLTKAWALPSARRYAPLRSQSFAAICGPTSVANVLRSITGDARRNPLRGPGFRPMTVEQLAREADEVVPDDWAVTVVRPSTVEALRDELRASNHEHRRVVANFSRAAIFGRGGGHHSPIGGYLEEEDLAFVLDVNASYGPWLVSTERLFDAVKTFDSSGTRLRGLARFERLTGTRLTGTRLTGTSSTHAHQR